MKCVQIKMIDEAKIYFNTKTKMCILSNSYKQQNRTNLQKLACNSVSIYALC